MLRRRVTASAFSPAGLVQNSVLLVTAFIVLSPLVPLVYQALLDRPIYDDQAQQSWLGKSEQGR
jgi:hypothetical protein